MKRPEAVLFDMDGVLVESFDAWVAVLDACRVRRGMPPLGPQPIRDSWGQGIAADCRTFFPGEKPEVLAREYDQGFLEHLDLVHVVEGAPGAVAGLAAHAKLALVTNSPVGMARRVLAAKGMLPHFAALACGDEVEVGKPDPAIVRLALSRVGAAASEAALVGDTAYDVEAGRRAGVFVVGFRVDGGDVRIESHAELPAALGF